MRYTDRRSTFVSNFRSVPFFGVSVSVSSRIAVQQVGSYSYEPNAFKYGDKPQSYSVVTVPARNIWQRNFHIEFDFRTFYPNGILFVALVSDSGRGQWEQRSI